MSPVAIELKVGRGTLVAVPAVHFRLPFAAAVNALCGDPATRPDAIAVELGPEAATAASAWLQDLGMGPDRRRQLPCLLGLARSNRLLHPRVRERAIALQREHGCGLEGLPAELLERELGFRGQRVLPLSPTDSIIEAVRCATELGVQIYGVDLEESAEDGAASPVIGEDPWLAIGDLQGYVERNARRTLAHHDPLIDGRREQVMAARLKAILAVNDRVLLTCGLGHWSRLAGLLADPSVRPATAELAPASPPAGKDCQWQRFAMHPSLAVPFLELPHVTLLWELVRSHPHLGGASSVPSARWPLTQFAQVLQRTCNRHFEGTAPAHEVRIRSQDWVDLDRFFQLLAGELALELRIAPHLGLILACAEATLSKEFQTLLTEELMRFPWARPNPAKGIGSLVATQDGRVGWLSGARSLPSVVQGWGPLLAEPQLRHWTWPLPPADGQSPDQQPTEPRSGVFTWRPWERLATALSAQASGLVERRGRVPDSAPFAGQWLEGPDVRRTVRAHARGDEQIFVRDGRPAQTKVPQALIDAFPVVWIFDPNKRPSNRFDILRTHVPWLQAAASDPAALGRLIAADEDGEDMVDLVVCRSRKVTEFGAGIATYRTHGWILFRPQCPSLRQAADYMVRTRMPVRPTYSITLAGELPPEVSRALDLDGGPGADQSAWQDVLVRLALAFGGPRVTVVAPEGLVLSPWVQAQAQRHGQMIGRVPLSAFQPEQVARCRTIQMVPAEVQGAEAHLVYRGHPERILGESEDRFRELVPEHWRPFLW